jgi:hypothetical protein
MPLKRPDRGALAAGRLSARACREMTFRDASLNCFTLPPPVALARFPGHHYRRVIYTPANIVSLWSFLIHEPFRLSIIAEARRSPMALSAERRHTTKSKIYRAEIYCHCRYPAAARRAPAAPLERAAATQRRLLGYDASRHNYFFI